MKPNDTSSYAKNCNAGSGTGFVPCSPVEAVQVWERVKREAERRQAPREQPEVEEEKVASDIVAEKRREAERLAEEIVQQARRQARQIVEEAEQVRRDASRQFQEALGALVGQFEEQLQEQLRQIDHEMPGLIVEMAEKVIAQRIERDDKVVVGVVREALKQVAGARQVQIQVNPADEPAVRAAQEELLRDVQGATLRITGSDDIQRGGAIITTERGEMDARIEVQLQILSDALQQAVGGER